MWRPQHITFPLTALAFLSVLPCLELAAQCANNNLLYTTVTPTCPGSSTVPCVYGGEYVLVNVVSGNTYTFSTCGNALWDTQITLYNNLGGGSLGFNDDGCGLQSTITWVATFTGQLRVLVDQFPCISNSLCANLVIACGGGPPPVVCGSQVYDPGGAAGNYPNGSNFVQTYCPSVPGDVLTMTFNSFATEAGWDFVTIYNGPNTGSPSLGTFSGTTIPGPFTSTHPGGCLTLAFSSDLSVAAAGWSATLTCGPPPPPPSGDCVYTLTLLDSFGDGWGSSAVGVSINGGPFTYYTVTGSSNQILLGVDINDVIVLDYNNSGPWQGENSFSLTLMGGILYTSGTAPAAGINYAGTVSCQPPPAPPEDCIGGFTICNDQGFNNSPSNTGSVTDLNASNYGCLLDAERQGTWYNFSASASGTLAFTISPSNGADDYDFALWGPFPPGSSVSSICPPLGAPLRCSYAAPSGDTGLNFTATDQSESAFGDKWVQYLDVQVGEVYLLYISNWSQSGLAFDLDWDASSTASLDCTVLPISVVGLFAEPVGGQVLVGWSTFSEVGSERFLVERAGADHAFEVIGILPAAGYSLAVIDYRMHDNDPLLGTNHYRVREESMDGTYRYSPVVSVDHKGGSRIHLYPVPVGGSLNVVWEGGAEASYRMRIMDAAGQIMGAWEFMLPDGRLDRTIPLMGYDAGSYLLQVIDAHGVVVTSQRFIKI